MGAVASKAPRSRLLARLRFARPSALILAATLAPPAAKAAAPTHVGLVWRRGAGADGCPDANALLVETSQRLDSSIELASGERAGSPTIEGDVTRTEDTWEAHLLLVSAARAVEGERTIRMRGSDCRDLAEAL